MSKHSKVVDEEITISTFVNNHVVVAAATVVIGNEEIMATGISKRHPDDKFDEELGRQLAAGRALEILSRRILKRANGKVKSIDDSKKALNAVNDIVPTEVSTSLSDMIAASQNGSHVATALRD